VKICLSEFFFKGACLLFEFCYIAVLFFDWMVLVVVDLGGQFFYEVVFLF
jgi:hypothetical protein